MHRALLASAGLTLATLSLPTPARADTDCARVRPAAARASCEAVLRAIRDDDAATFVAALSPSGAQRIDRYLPRGERSARLDHASLAAAVGASPRAFLRLGPPAEDGVVVVHHVREPHGGDVPSFVRIEIRARDAIATVALGGDGWTIDLVVIRPRRFRD